MEGARLLAQRAAEWMAPMNQLVAPSFAPFGARADRNRSDSCRLLPPRAPASKGTRL